MCVLLVLVLAVNLRAAMSVPSLPNNDPSDFSADQSILGFKYQLRYPPEEVDEAQGETADLEVRGTRSSEDRDIVQRIFAWIFEETRIFNQISGFQVIITDHAELTSPEFRAAQIDLPRWRAGENSLVPPDWISG